VTLVIYWALYVTARAHGHQLTISTEEGCDVDCLDVPLRAPHQVH